MSDVRCKCGKIICQLQDQVVLIKCRHCKRFVILEFNKSEEKDGAILTKDYPKIEYR